MQLTKKELQDELNQIMSTHSDFEMKIKFGSQAYERKGNMVAGIFQDMLVLNLGKEAVDQLLQKPHTKKMDIIGRVLEDWIILEEEFYKDRDNTHKLINQAVERVRKLPYKFA